MDQAGVESGLCTTEWSPKSWAGSRLCSQIYRFTNQVNRARRTWLEKLLGSLIGAGDGIIEAKKLVV